MPYEKHEDELGALWISHGPNSDYMTGEINGVKVFCTPTKSEHPKAPTWRVFKSKPRADKEQRQTKPLEDTDIPF